MSERSDHQPPKKKGLGYFKCCVCQQQGTDHVTVYPSTYSLKRHMFASHLHPKGFILRCGIPVSHHHPVQEWMLCGILENAYDNTEEDPIREDGVGIGGNVHSTNTTTKSHLNLYESECQRPFKFVQTGHAHTETVNVDQGVDIFTDDDVDVVFFKHMTALTNEPRQANNALSLAQLKADYGLNQVAIGAVQQWAEGLLTSLTGTIIGGVKSNLTKANMTPSIEDAFEIGNGLANPFHGLNSEWMLMKVLSDNLVYVKPETVILMEDLNTGGQRKIHSMQYVPILHVLKLLYSDRRLGSEISNKRPEADGIMADFLHGTYFCNHPLFTRNCNALQLQLYYDGFEVVNPLGSKIQKHNLGAIYFSILNLDPAYRSTLKSICLTTFVFENDINHPDIGWGVILRRLKPDLWILEDMSFCKGPLLSLHWDSKAAHSIFGLQDCFYGEKTCISRYCGCTSADIQVKVWSKECELRSRQSFKRDVDTMEKTGQPTNGLRARCYIGSRYFHCADAYVADDHYDILEGLIPAILKPILQELIKKQFFSVDQLNQRIARFYYNTQDAQNKPSAISDAKLKDDSRSLKQYAAQYWCLLRKLPLLIGDGSCFFSCLMLWMSLWYLKWMKTLFATWKCSCFFC